MDTRIASKDSGVERVPRRLAAFLGVVLAMASGCGMTAAEPAEADGIVEVTVSSDRRGTAHLSLGITHTQFSADSSNDPLAVAESRRLLSSKKLLQNQHIMGWGALNPEPSPGVYDWTSLDSRMNLIRETSGIPVITLCCAPDWMKGGAPGTTDWSRIDAAPTPEHYADFAALAGTVARRYPDVKHFQVWNGLKGFYDSELGRWDFEGYTTLYNLVYRELKSVDGRIAVGGPYVTIDSWSDSGALAEPSSLKGSWGVIDQRSKDAVEYWLKHKEGADFITLDMSVANKDEIHSGTPFESTAKFRTVARWIRDRTDLPLWAARWHPLPKDSDEWGPEQQSALLTAGLVELIDSEVSVALLWQPQARDRTCSGCLWTDTRVPGGGRSTSAFASIDSLTASFPPGTPLLRIKSSSRDITALASPMATLLINEVAEPLVVKLNEVPTQLDPYEVRVVPRSEPKAPGEER